MTLRVNHKRRRKITQGTFGWIFRKLDLEAERNKKILCGWFHNSYLMYNYYSAKNTYTQIIH